MRAADEAVFSGAAIAPELIRIDWLFFRAAEKAMVPGAVRRRATEEEFRRTKGGTGGRTDMLRRS